MSAIGTDSITKNSPGTPAALSGRLNSLDQFRGYTVAGMFVVNFCGGLQAIPDWIKHHDTYVSFADTIMPSFLFAAGFSFRLTMLRRIARDGAFAAYSHAIWRGLALVIVSLAMYGFNDSFVKSWEEVNPHQVWDFIAGMIKANLWETLAIIGVSQIVILPFIAQRTPVVALGAVSLLLGHMLFTYSFNFNFMFGQPNWLDAYWGAEDAGCWDGGCFGTMSWGAIALFGALAHDLVIGKQPIVAAKNLMLGGIGLMVIAYGFSCLSTLYDVPMDKPKNDKDIADSPVFPKFEQFSNPGLRLAELPFFAPPPNNPDGLQKPEGDVDSASLPRYRPYNYWMMSKRLVSMPFAIFSAGFGMCVLALFMLVTDIGGVSLGLFRTFGTNALAAYFLHHSIEYAVLGGGAKGIVPEDSPLWWCLIGLAIFYVTTYLFIRFLEKHRIYIRL